MPRTITILLAGDVMTGRGIDQALEHPGDPTLHEPEVRDARHYVSLAEAAHGSFPRPISPAHLWGDALAELSHVRPAMRIVNLETSITVSDEWCRDKEVHYRMHPDNIGCLAAAGIDVATVANNHSLDWGRAGFLDTLASLRCAGIRHAGGGASCEDARQPAWRCRGDLGVLVFAEVEADGGRLIGLRMVPTQMRRFGLRRAGRPDAEWLAATLSRTSRRFGCAVKAGRHGLVVR